MTRFSTSAACFELREAIRVVLRVGIRLDGRLGFLEPGDLADLMLFRYDQQAGEIHVEQTICAPTA